MNALVALQARPLEGRINAVRADKKLNVPVIMTREEVATIYLSAGRYRPTGCQTALRERRAHPAVRLRVKAISGHTFRHSFALLQRGTDIRTIQQRIGHNDLPTTMIYILVLQLRGQGVPSSLDDLGV